MLFNGREEELLLRPFPPRPISLPNSSRSSNADSENLKGVPAILLLDESFATRHRGKRLSNVRNNNTGAARTISQTLSHRRAIRKVSLEMNLCDLANNNGRVSATNMTSEGGRKLRAAVWKDIVAVLSKVDESIAEIVGSRS